jgi:taurine dioxygenase
MGSEDRLHVRRLAGALGAEVRGIALGRADASEAAKIEALLLEHQVLFFPEQELTVEEHVAFGRNLGPLAGHPHLDNPFLKHPEIFELAASRGGVADEWHSDLSFLPEPSVMSILRMVRAPAFGGDTMWASPYRAFEELSAPMRELCEGLSALHDATPHGRSDRMHIHPVVRVHPKTGRKALTQHFVLNDFDEERIIQRVTVMGDRPTGSPPRWEPFVRPGRLTATSRHDRQLFEHLKQRDGEKS